MFESLRNESFKGIEPFVMFAGEQDSLQTIHKRVPCEGVVIECHAIPRPSVQSSENSSHTKMFKEAVAKIADLDLSVIQEKLCASKEHRGMEWTQQRAQEAIIWYRRMLVTVYLYFDHAAPLTDDMDEVWHTHILHTDKYRTDCQALFGRFLDHMPCSPSSPQGVVKAMKDSFTMTQGRFLSFFGKLPDGVVAQTALCKCGNERCCGNDK